MPLLCIRVVFGFQSGESGSIPFKVFMMTDFELGARLQRNSAVKCKTARFGARSEFSYNGNENLGSR